jgi:hypothetical protein
MTTNTLKDKTEFEIEMTTQRLASSAYMGHKVLDSKGKQISYQSLKAMPNVYHNVHVGGDYHQRIYTIKS